MAARRTLDMSFCVLKAILQYFNLERYLINFELNTTYI